MAGRANLVKFAGGDLGRKMKATAADCATSTFSALKRGGQPIEPFA
jgi:hypothetical protein